MIEVDAMPRIFLATTLSAQTRGLVDGGIVATRAEVVKFRCTRMESDVFSSIIQGLPSRVWGLLFDDTSLRATSRAEALASAIARGSVTDLRIRRCTLTSGGMRKIARAIRDGKVSGMTVSCASLSQAGVRDELFQAIISDRERWTWIHLDAGRDRNVFTAAQWLEVAALPNIHSLGMSITPFVAEKDIRTLSDTLASSRIQTLTLSDSGDGIPHLVELIRGIAKMPLLQNLTITSDFLKVPEVYQIFQRCPRLKVIDIGVRRLPIPTLKEVLPHLRWPLQQLNYVAWFMPGPIPCSVAEGRIRQFQSRHAEIMAIILSAGAVGRIGARSPLAILPPELLRLLKTHLYG